MTSFFRAVGSILRGVGQTLDKSGASIQGKTGYLERIPVHARFLEIGSAFPKTADATFVAPSASLVGDVSIGNFTSVFYGSIVRGDSGGGVSIGKMSHIGDRVHIQDSKNASVKIGDAVFIGSSVSIGAGVEIEHGAHIAPGCFIGDGCKIGRQAVLAPGTVLAPNTAVKEHELWAGSKAAFVRKVDEGETKQFMTAAGASYWLGKIHDEHHNKTTQQLLEDRGNYEDEWQRAGEYGEQIHNYIEPEPMPRLDNFVYPLQLRTYFEVDASVTPINDARVVWIEKDQEPEQVMTEMLTSFGPARHNDKRSYWFVD